MTEIRLTNTRTRTKEPFAPIDPDDVRMYVCGPTVYDRAHLGNARPAVVFDVLYRLLRHVYGADHVTYVRNITDVEDKIIDRARANGEAIEDLTRRTTGWYHADMDALGVLRPDEEPHATDYVTQMIEMIEALIARGCAYAADGHVLFSVASFPDYGALSGRSVEDMIAGARVEVAPYKRDPMDFVLWKPSADDEPGWESPWGRGRPGWHIECSAMSEALLGASFDIHGGGADLMFPHHENEVAQSCCAHPEGSFARYWLHNEMLLVEGRKMSKSLGNFFTVRDLLEGDWFGGSKVPGEVIRYVFLNTHYRKPMDWTEAKVREAEKRLRHWYILASGDVEDTDPPDELISALADDLNTKAALDVIHKASLREDMPAVKAGMKLMGFLEAGMGAWTAPRASTDPVQVKIERVLDAWAQARSRKDFELADHIRDRANEIGISLQVKPDKSVDYRFSASGMKDDDYLHALQGLLDDLEAMTRAE
ncbi:cysteine--tRNA ligase [Rhodosalinus sediminis]|uniref:cysteine--tRNA ligase n=1 Tax=Rhodosalinus sediminis TaxID=1940533 RepID=UPI002354840F|nr:cysteine--tRNA ligase [Rhodosalinus sediminis]